MSAPEHYPKNPAHERALTAGEIVPGLPFAIFVSGRLATRGVFTQAPEYDDEWDGCKAIIGHESEPRNVDVYEMGIAPQPDGTWAETFTVFDGDKIFSGADQSIAG